MSRESNFGGVDIGASATKVAILDGSRELDSSDVRKTGVSFETCAQEAMEAALQSCGKDRKDQLPFSSGRRYSLPPPPSDKPHYVAWDCYILTMRGILTEARGDQHGLLLHPFLLQAHRHLLQR